MTRNSQIDGTQAAGALVAPELLREGRGVGERPHGVAGDDPVAARPHERPERGERGVLRARAPVHGPRDPEEVEAGDQPRLGPEHPRHGEHEEHGRAAARRARLEHRRPDDDRHVRDVDVPAGGVEGEVQARADERRGHEPDERRERLAPQPVDPGDERDERRDAEEDPDPLRDVAERREHRADPDGQRMRRRRAVRVVGWELPVEQLTAPEQRVVRVVVRVRREREEAPDGPGAEDQEGDPRPPVGPPILPSGGCRRGDRPRPGEGRALHEGK